MEEGDGGLFLPRSGKGKIFKNIIVLQDVECWKVTQGFNAE